MLEGDCTMTTSHRKKYALLAGTRVGQGQGQGQARLGEHRKQPLRRVAGQTDRRGGGVGGEAASPLKFLFFCFLVETVSGLL